MTGRIAIVDPFSSGRVLAEEVLRTCPLKPLAVISDLDLPEFYMRTFKEAHFSSAHYPPHDVAALADELAKKGVTSILPGSEPGVLLAHDLAKHLGLRRNRDETRASRRDKFLMSETIAAKGLRSVRQNVLSEAKLAIQWIASNVPYPAILKPRDSAGTQGVQVVHSDHEVEEYFRRYLGTKNLLCQEIRDILVQEKLEGTEYVVDTVSLDARHELIALWKYNKCLSYDGSVIYDTMELISLDDESDRSVVKYIFDVLDALGVTDGPAHSEVMLTKDGPCLIETGARIHGGNGTLISGKCLGYNQIDRTIAAFHNPEMFRQTFHERYQPRYRAVEVFLISSVEGKFRELKSLDRISNLSSYSNHTWNLNRGEQITKTHDLITSPGRIILSGDRNEIRDDLQAIREWEKQAYVVE
jgi:biotin carboxylase